jgi:hypothetical protein
MQLNRVLIIFLILLNTACTKEWHNELPLNDADTVQHNNFIQYTIKKGEHFSDKNFYKETQYRKLSFLAKFDSSAVYSTADTANQQDINKLYGFADNNNLHHINSARFGWRWYNQRLEIFAYVYVNRLLLHKIVGIARLNTEEQFSIEVLPEKYIFRFNNIIEEMPRFSKDSLAIGYKLYPYFGGDEPAPRDISIFIKEF